MRAMVIVCALVAAARGDVSTSGDARGTAADPILRVELRPRPGLTATVTAWVLATPGGKTLWRRPPTPMLPELDVDQKTYARYQRNPRATLASLSPNWLARPVTLLLRDAIALYANEQFMIFARSDGKTLFEQTMGESGFGDLSYARAELTVECEGGRRVVETITEHVRLVDCGSRLVFLHGPGISVFKTSPYAIEESMMFPDVVHDYRFKVGAAKIIVKVLEP